MTTLALAEQFESIQNEAVAPWVSKRYRLEKTPSILHALTSLGWTLVSIRGSKRNPYAPHTLAFAKGEKKMETGAIFTPVVYVQNGHDGKTTLKFRVGFYNDLGQSFMADEEVFGFSVRHYQKALNYAEEFIQSADLENKLEDMFLSVEKMILRNVTPEERNRFVRGALIVRWTDPDKKRRVHNIDPDSVSKANNLFQLYSDMLLCLVGGGEYRMAKNGQLIQFKVRGVRSSVAEAKYKERLWTWTQKFMERS